MGTSATRLEQALQILTHIKPMFRARRAYSCFLAAHIEMTNPFYSISRVNYLILDSCSCIVMTAPRVDTGNTCNIWSYLRQKNRTPTPQTKTPPDKGGELAMLPVCTLVDWCRLPDSNWRPFHYE